MFTGQGKSIIERLVDKEGSWRGFLYLGLFLQILVIGEFFLGHAVVVGVRPIEIYLLERSEWLEFRNQLIFQFVFNAVFIIAPALWARKIEKDFHENT